MEATNKKADVIPRMGISKNQYVGKSEHLKVCTNLGFCAGINILTSQQVVKLLIYDFFFCRDLLYF